MKTTRGTETSKYPEEEKENSIPPVAASEEGRAQTVWYVMRGCRTSEIDDRIAEHNWKVGPQKVKVL